MKRRVRGMTLAALLGVGLLAGNAEARQNTQSRQAFTEIFGTAESDLEPYIIRPNDVLQIYVYGEDDYDDPVLVLPDGRISVPLAQDIMAAGLTPGQLKLRLEGALGDFIMVPNVTVSVVAIQSYRVFVTGSVRQPGALLSETPINVLQALALAGGFGEFPKRNEITVLRRSGAETVVFDFHYDSVVRGDNPAQNMLLASGDVVVVPGD